jgi:hypothetical protein
MAVKVPPNRAGVFDVNNVQPIRESKTRESADIVGRRVHMIKSEIASGTAAGGFEDPVRSTLIQNLRERRDSERERTQRIRRRKQVQTVKGT